MIHFTNNVLHSFLKDFKCDSISFCLHSHLLFPISRCSDNKVLVTTQVYWYKNKVTVPWISRILKRYKQNTISGDFIYLENYRSSHRRCSVKTAALKNFVKFHRKAHVLESVLRLQGCNFTKTPTQVFSCEICQIVKVTHFEEHLKTTASEN